MKKTLVLSLLMLSGLTLPADTAVAQTASQGRVDLTQAAGRAVESVVYIKVTQNSRQQMVDYVDPFEDFFGGTPFGDFFGRGQGGGGRQQRRVETPKRQGAGSGVIISSDGYIVTNNHVVDGADVIEVKLNDNSEYRARIIGTDATTDLALLKVEAQKLPAIHVASSEDLKLGEWVLAIGNPYGLTSTVTAGIVSAKARNLGARPGSVESFIQTDAAINPGNSGGALVNAAGELVGINAMLYSQTGSFAGYGFAIPTSIMQKVVADLKQFGCVQRALLGIKGTDVSAYIDQQREKEKEVDLGTMQGVYVAEVVSGGSADKAGLREGDVITAMDGHQVSKFGEMSEIIATHRPGDKVTVAYLRAKKPMQCTLTLLSETGSTEAVQPLDTDELGVGLRPLTAEEKKEFNLSCGLMIIAVREGKMKDAGAIKGLILLRANDKELRTNDDFDEAVRAANSSTDRTLWLRAKTQSGLNKSIVVELDEKKAKK